MQRILMAIVVKPMTAEGFAGVHCHIAREKCVADRVKNGERNV